MKRLILVPLVAMFFTTAAQKSLSIQVGPSYSHLKGIDFSKSIGYFGGLNFQDKFSQVLGVDASLYFLNQRSTAGDITVSTRSINAIFAVNLFPGHSGLYFIVGPELGHDLDYKMEGESIDIDKDLRFAAVGGIGYQVIENAAIFARCHYAVDHQGSGYDYNVQVGLNYRFSTRPPRP